MMQQRQLRQQLDQSKNQILELEESLSVMTQDYLKMKK